MKAQQTRTAEAKLSGPTLLVIAAAAAAAFYEWLVFATTFVRPGVIGINYVGVGTDWMVFHAAARAWLGGHLSMIYDGHRFTAFLNQSYRPWLSASLPFRPWVYPPSFLLLLAPFGALSFPTAFAAFQLLSFAALFAAIVVGARDRRKAWLIAGCAILSPAAAVNAVCGQNAVLMAALLVGGFRLVGARPLLAGALLGLSTFKPQFAVLAPVALLALREWKALAAFVASAAGLAGASLVVFGAAAWIAWVHLTLQSMAAAPSSDWVEYGRMWDSSVWTCAMLFGAPEKLASALQLAAVAGAAGAVWLAFARPLDQSARIAVLLAAACLAAPHWSPYDAVLLAMAGLYWLLREPEVSAASWRWLVFLLLWLAPVLSPPLLIPAARLTPLLLAGFVAAAIWRRPAVASGSSPASLTSTVRPRG